MSIQTHEQILMEQFNAVLADVKFWTDRYKKTHKQTYLMMAAQNWGILRGLAMAAKQFGIVRLQDALDSLAFEEEDHP